MYKNKGLKRSYVFAYINVLFGSTLPVLLLMKTGVVAPIIMLLVVLCDLAALIVAHVFYSKNDKVFFYVGVSAIGLFDVITLVGLIMEIVLTAQGKISNYAWFVLIFNTISAVLVTLFFALDIRKKKLKAKEEAEKEANVKALFENA